jgi:hypothetical protein
MTIAQLEGPQFRFSVAGSNIDYCSSCAQGAREDLRFFDLDAAFDAGAFARYPDMIYVAGSDHLLLCEDCVRQLSELAGFQPELHRRQFVEIQRLRKRLEFVEGTLRRLRDELSAQIEANLTAPPVRPAPPRDRRALAKSKRED